MQQQRLRARLCGGALEQARHVAQALAGVARGLARGRQQLRVRLPAAAFRNGPAWVSSGVCSPVFKRVSTGKHVCT
jgi:hypothetical protein